MAITPINLLVEGDTDEVIIRRILEHVRLPCGIVYGKQGKANLLKRLPSYNQAARFAPWLVVVDLDQDTDCAPDFVRTMHLEPFSGMRFRVAVRAVEAWLLADIEHLAAFLGVSAAKIPSNPDAEINPKRTLINLARQSRWKAIQHDIVPRQGSGGRVGPAYTSRLIEFVTLAERGWRPEVASRHSDSLRRCMVALQDMKSRESNG